MQDIYATAQRFEDPEYQDIVTQVITLAMGKNDSTIGITPEKFAGLAAPKEDSKLGRKVLSVGNLVFPAEAVRTAITQVKKLTLAAGGQDTAETTAEGRDALVETVRTDLKFYS